MKPFPYVKVLDYRRHLRLERRQELAEVLAEERDLLAHRSRLDEEKQRQLEDLGRLAESNELSVEAAARRRYFAGQLEIEVMVVDEQILKLREEIEARRLALVGADQDVQSLERLEEKHVAREEYEGQRRTEMELGDQWQSAKLMSGR